MMFSELAHSLLAQSVLAQTFTERLIESYLNQFASPVGIAALLVGVVAAGLVLTIDSSKWVALSLAIYLATFAIKRGGYLTELPSPFSAIAASSQGMVFGLGALLGIAAIKPPLVQRNRIVIPAMICIMLMGYTYCLRQMSGQFIEKGISGFIVYTMVFLVLGRGIGRWLYDETQVRNLARSVSWAAGLLIFMSLILAVISRDAAFAATRFMGTTPNPQRAGAMMGMTLPFCFALMMDKNNAINSRVTHAAIAGFAIILLIATGSRTGGLMMLVGSVVFFRARIGSILLALAGVGAFLIVGYILLGDSVGDGGEHLTDTNNTRAEVWVRLLGQWLESPWIGTPFEGVPGESSYLSILVMAGIPGGLAMLAVVYFLSTSAYRFIRQSSRLGSLQVYGDLAAASICQMLVSWVFEAFALGALTDHMLTVYCTFGIVGFLEEHLHNRAAEAERGFDVVQREWDDAAPHAARAGSVNQPLGGLAGH